MKTYIVKTSEGELEIRAKTLSEGIMGMHFVDDKGSHVGYIAHPHIISVVEKSEVITAPPAPAVPVEGLPTY